MLCKSDSRIQKESVSVVCNDLSSTWGAYSIMSLTLKVLLPSTPSWDLTENVVLVVQSRIMSDSQNSIWTIACQATLPMGFSRQECWSGLPFPSPGDFSYPGTEPASPVSPSLASGFFTTSTTWEALNTNESATVCVTVIPPMAGKRVRYIRLSVLHNLMDRKRQEWYLIHISQN